MHIQDDLAKLTLRVTFGALIAGHGAQKLTGAFGGHGYRGTTQMVRNLGLLHSHLGLILVYAASVLAPPLTVAGVVARLRRPR